MRTATSSYLNRPLRERGELPPTTSPWGHVDNRDRLAEGIWRVDTPSHGGIWLSPARAKLVPRYIVAASFLRRADWWEEDCDQAWPRLIFGDEIGLVQKDQALKALEIYRPKLLHRYLEEID